MESNMKTIQKKSNNFHKKEINKLTRKIENLSPGETLNLISEITAKIEDSHVKEWLLRFKATFQHLQAGGKTNVA